MFFQTAKTNDLRKRRVTESEQLIRLKIGALIRLLSRGEGQLVAHRKWEREMIPAFATVAQVAHTGHLRSLQGKTVAT